MNITLVTGYFYPEISSVTHLYADLAEDLEKAGHSVTVVTSAATRGLDAAVRKEYLTRRDETAPSGYRILRVGNAAGEDLSSTIRRGLQLLRNTVALFRTAKSIPTDIYLIGSMPPTLGYIGTWLNRKAPTVYILQDIFPDSICQMGLFPERHPLIRLFRLAERRIYRGNSRFVTISEDMRQTLIRKGVPSERIDVIENWSDPDSVRPVPRDQNPLFRELGLDPGRFYAVYAGALGILQNPSILADAAAALRDCPDLSILVFGDGNQKEMLLSRIRDEQLSNLHCFPLQPEDRVSEVYSLGSISLIPLKRGTTRIAVPSKTWTILAAGQPVLCTADPGSWWEQAITESGCGLCTPPEDGSALADAIRFLYQNPERVLQMGRNSRAAAEHVYTRQNATRKYLSVIEKEAHRP